MIQWIFYQLKNRFQRLRELPIDEETQYCYMPTDDWPGILCDDLPKWLHPLNVATWSPTGKERHVLEWLVCTIGAIVLFTVIMRRHKSAKKGFHRHPLPWIYLLAGLYHVRFYKYYLPLPQRGWFTTPCHMGWVIRLTLHFVPLPEPVADILRHALLCFSSLAALFIFQPDGEATDAILGYGYNWSLIHHLLLISIPIYDVATGRVSVLPPPPLGNHKPPSVIKYFLKWHLISIACYVLVYGTFVTPISLLSGVNWGWTIHFHATRLATQLGLRSAMYRPIWFVYCNICFIIFRLQWMLLDFVLRESGLSQFSRSNILKIQSKLQERSKLAQKQAAVNGVSASNGHTNGCATTNGVH